MQKGKLTITLEEIKSRENDAMTSSEILIKKMKNSTRSSPKSEFLYNIEVFLKKLIDGGVPYRKISIWIYDTYAFKVSEQMVRSYAYNVLKVPKKRTAKYQLDDEDNKQNNISISPTSRDNNITTVKEQKRVLSNRKLSNKEQEETL